jgi:hypothetical protein
MSLEDEAGFTNEDGIRAASCLGFLLDRLERSGEEDIAEDVQGGGEHSGPFGFPKDRFVASQFGRLDRRTKGTSSSGKVSRQGKSYLDSRRTKEKGRSYSSGWTILIWMRRDPSGDFKRPVLRHPAPPRGG